MTYSRPIIVAARKRFVRKLKRFHGHQLWTGSRNKNGYPTFSFLGESWLAHRWNYFILHGKPDSPELHHKCPFRRCVTLRHLQPVDDLTHPDKPTVVNRAKRSCPQGHAYSGSNLYVDKAGSRHCKTCRLAAAKRRYKKHRGQIRRQQAGYYSANRVAILLRRHTNRRLTSTSARSAT
jgi:hypothetical protein